MPDNATRIDARALKAALHDGGEIALLDAREEGIFARRHLLMASCVPLGRLELMLDALVPRRSARTVWCDDGDGSALAAASRMRALGYSDVAVLEGGIAAWEAAGFRVYSGVHVPSKAFAEVVEHEAGTPHLTAPELKALIDDGADIAIFDSRSYEEYHNNSIPGAVSVPGAELVYRFTDLAPSPETTIIVNCGGRTRSIIGAQSLRNAGFRNKIMSLKDGTMAWHLAGYDVVAGAAKRPPEVSPKGLGAAQEAAARVAKACDIRRIDQATLAAWQSESDRRSLYVLDVRTPEEYAAGHLAGAHSAPGGQLVQETDAHIATLGARVVLVDDNGVRATMTASWLRQIGWTDVAVLTAGPEGGDWVAGRDRPRVLGLDGLDVALIAPAALHEAMAAGKTVVVDLATSREYARGHIPGACFLLRSQLREALPRLPAADRLVLTSPEGALAQLAAAELAGAPARVAALAGGTAAWVAAGNRLEAGATHMASPPDDVVLSARERGQGREEAMREYLAWEINLVNDMATDDDQRFRVLTPA